MAASIEVQSLAVRRRRQLQHEERRLQKALARMLERHFNRSCVFWSSLENRPRSAISGFIQKQCGVRSGLPDVLVVFRRKAIGIELKSRAGVASPAQKRVREEMVAAGCDWWLAGARSVRAAMLALQRSGVVFRRPWTPSSPPADWEGPFDLADSKARLPSHPTVAARRKTEKRRYRERVRARKAAHPVLAQHGKAIPRATLPIGQKC